MKGKHNAIALERFWIQSGGELYYTLAIPQQELEKGSIYEMFGNECCLSTGEVIKITGLKIKKIMAEICEDNTRDSVSWKPFELPMNFP
ncbi:hypothetical protein STEG23_010437, partial [Scotinomys teguina]